MLQLKPKKRFAPPHPFLRLIRRKKKLVAVLVFVLVVLPVCGFVLWANFRYLWLKRSAHFYQNNSTNFTFYYPRGFDLFRLEDLKLRNKDFMAGFKRIERDSIACGVIELTRPSGYKWNPEKELEASLNALANAQKEFEKKEGKVIRGKYAAAVFIDHFYQHDHQTRARNQQIAFPTKDKFYYLTCGGPADVFDNYKYGFELFFKTFTVL